MPSVVAMTMGVASPLVGGVVVATLMGTGALSVAALRSGRRGAAAGHRRASLGVAVSLFGIQQQRLGALLAGTVIAGLGSEPILRHAALACRPRIQISAAACLPPSTCSRISRSACRRWRRGCRSRWSGLRRPLIATAPWSSCSPSSR